MATPTNQFRLKLAPSTAYNFSIDWGDGFSEIFDQTTSSNEDNAGLIHTYSTPGVYNVSIIQNNVNGFPRLFFNGANNTHVSNDCIKVINVAQWGSPNWSSLADSFEGCVNLSAIAAGGNTLSAVSNFATAWRNCSLIENFPLLDTKNGTNFSGTWQRCGFNSFPLIDTSKGINFSFAWSDCSSLTAFPTLNTSNGTNFYAAWNACNNLKTFPLIDTSKGINFSFAWSDCSSLTAFPTLNTSNGTNFYAAWNACNNLKTFPLIDTSKGTNFEFGWSNCSSLTSFPLIDTLSGVSFFATWNACSNLKTFPLLNTSNAININQAWRGCVSLSQFPLINTSKVIDFNYAWSECESLTSFPLIDTSNGVDFRGAWFGCKNLSASNFPLLNLSKMLCGFDCFASVKLPTSSYSSLLISLCSTNFNTGVVFSGGSSKYNSSASNARNFLINNRSWSITDAGLE
jgi:hypothetical protein